MIDIEICHSIHWIFVQIGTLNKFCDIHFYVGFLPASLTTEPSAYQGMARIISYLIYVNSNEYTDQLSFWPIDPI